MKKFYFIGIILIIFYFIFIYGKKDVFKGRMMAVRFKFFVNLLFWIFIIVYAIALIALLFK